MTPWFLLLLVVLLLGLQAIFVAAEFSLVTVDRSSVESDADEGDRKARGVLAGLRSLSTQLSGAQVGITITSLIVGYLAEPAIAELLRTPMAALGLPEQSSLAISLALALIIATAAQMVLGELIPKNAAIAQPRRVAELVTPAQRFFTKLCTPIIWVTNGTANWLLRRIGIEPVEELASARSPQELASLVRHSGASGTLPSGTASLIDRTLRFGDHTAEDVMTPRTRLEVVQRSQPVAEILQLSRKTGLSRFPVIGADGLDDVVGVASLRDALRVPAADRGRATVGSVMSAIARVPESLELGGLLRLVRSGNHLVLVVDEYGGTAGIATLEDLVEELVGEVADEYDRPALRSRRYQDGSWLLSGLLRPEEMRELGIPAADDPDYETLAGLIMKDLGRVADSGDQVEIPGWLLTVHGMDGRRIDAVVAVPRPEAAPDAGADPEDGEQQT